MTLPKKDSQTVTPDGESIAQPIAGVLVHYARTQADERGSLTELYDPRWGMMAEPMVYLYEFTIRPGAAKGWIMHKLQTDRIFLLRGAVRIVLYDDRATSPTYRMLNQYTLTEQNRGLICYPAGVYHALENVGMTEALLINLPTRPYNHEDPDKYRLPLDNDVIPFKFKRVTGW